MAYKGKIVSNPKTGQELKFLQTNKDTGGELLEIEAAYYSRSKEPALHYHPFQKEEFMVISGQLTIKLNETLTTLTAGQTFCIPPNTIHAMWNEADKITIVNWKVWPALDTEYLLETVNGLAADGRVRANGMPGFLQLASTANKYRNSLRLAKPSFAVQRILFGLLLPLACVCGYKPTYPKYLD